MDDLHFDCSPAGKLNSKGMVASCQDRASPLRRKVPPLQEASRNMKKLGLLACFGFVACLLPFAASRADLKADPAAGLATEAPLVNGPDRERRSPSDAKSVGRAIPFRGMIASVDERARTFTIAGKGHTRVLKITEKTVITKSDQPGTMKDVVVNEEVRGSYYKLTDDTLEARTVKLGPPTDSTKAGHGLRREKPRLRDSTRS